MIGNKPTNKNRVLSGEIMNDKFRSIFFPTEEEIKEQEKFLEELHNKQVEDRKNVKLVLSSDGVLHCREPFSSFLGDCCSCSHCYGNHQGVSEGGWCELHGIGCGWGFTCANNDSEWAIKIE